MKKAYLITELIIYWFIHVMSVYGIYMSVTDKYLIVACGFAVASIMALTFFVATLIKHYKPKVSYKLNTSITIYAKPGHFRDGVMRDARNLRNELGIQVMALYSPDDWVITAYPDGTEKTWHG